MQLTLYPTLGSRPDGSRSSAPTGLRDTVISDSATTSETPTNIPIPVQVKHEAPSTVRRLRSEPGRSLHSSGQSAHDVPIEQAETRTPDASPMRTANHDAYRVALSSPDVDSGSQWPESPHTVPVMHSTSDSHRAKQAPTRRSQK